MDTYKIKKRVISRIKIENVKIYNKYVIIFNTYYIRSKLDQLPIQKTTIYASIDTPARRIYNIRDKKNLADIPYKNRTQ